MVMYQKIEKTCPIVWVAGQEKHVLQINGVKVVRGELEKSSAFSTFFFSTRFFYFFRLIYVIFCSVFFNIVVLYEKFNAACDMKETLWQVY